MPGLHAKLSPSASKRWLNCTASPHYVTALITQGTIKGEQTSKYAEEGTEAHDWASRLLTGDIPLSAVPENFRPHVADYFRVCEECEDDSGEDSLRLVETKVPLFYSPEESGTVDYAYLAITGGKPTGLFIRDLKYGVGMPVDAEENTQLAIYAQSLIADLSQWWGVVPGHVPVSIGIHQPRYRGDEPLKLWDTTVKDLADFCKPITKAARLISRATSHEDLTFAPSAEVCQWCPAKAVCKERAAHDFTGFPVDIFGLNLLTNLDMPPIETVSLETLVSVWKHRKDISKWIENAEEHLTYLATAGTPAEGTKLVQGREGNRAWKDEVLAEKNLARYIKQGTLWKKSLISPAVAEKELKAAGVAKPAVEATMVKLTERAAGKEVLTTADDRREEVRPAITSFSVITDKEED